MKVLARPSDVLAALFTGAAVAAGRSATNRADELPFVFARLSYILGDGRRHCDKQSDRQNEQPRHAAESSILAAR